MIVGIGDASFKINDKAVGGVMLFLANTSMTKASLLCWKSKTITRACISSKDAETLNMATMVDDAVYTAMQVEILIFGEYPRRIKVKLFTDSESTLELVASSNQISTKTLRNVIVYLKERLVTGEILSYAWLSTHNMWADILTKGEKPSGRSCGGSVKE